MLCAHLLCFYKAISAIILQKYSRHLSRLLPIKSLPPNHTFCWPTLTRSKWPHQKKTLFYNRITNRQRLQIKTSLLGELVENPKYRVNTHKIKLFFPNIDLSSDIHYTITLERVIHNIT